MTALSIVIPAYNEEGGIADIIHRVLKIKKDLPAVGVDHFELVVVNDGSKDKTRQIAEGLCAECEDLRVINHPVNRGYGAALKTGFSHAKGDLIGFLDADGTYPPELFPKLCQSAINDSDLVVGSRMLGERSEMPFTRRIGNLFFARLISLLSTQSVSDCASGMRVFRREVLEQIYPLPDGLHLTPVMSARALHEGIRIKEIAIPYSERVGRSKLSVLRDGMIFLQSIIWTVLTYNPMRIFGMIGLAGLLFAAIAMLILLISRLSGVTSLDAWGIAGLFGALVAGVSGVSFFSLGYTFNFLVSFFYKRPIRQGLFGKPIFKKPLYRHFWWAGLLAILLSGGIATTSLVLGINGWEISRLWLYLLISAMMFLTGAQLVIYWILLRVMDELSRREISIHNDLHPI